VAADPKTDASITVTVSIGVAARGQRTASFLDRHPSGKPTVCDMMARQRTPRIPVVLGG